MCLVLVAAGLAACAGKPAAGHGTLAAISTSSAASAGSGASPTDGTAAPSPTSTHQAGSGGTGGTGTTTTHTAPPSPSATASTTPIRDYAVYWNRDACQMARGGGGDVIAMSFEIKYRGPGDAEDTSVYWSDAEGGNGLLDSGTADEPISKWDTSTNPQTVTDKATISFVDTNLSKYAGQKLTMTITIHPSDPDTDGTDDQATEYVNVPSAPPDDSTVHYITCQ
jgi:hypothetical protein